jgi:DNA-directed RNA polymerase beta' subunit
MTNDIVETYEILGIEAARRVIFENMMSIFQNNGIDDFNPHFFHMLADFMTHTGSLTKIDIHGIKNLNGVEVLQKAAFERPEEILTNASLHGDKDHLISPASNVMTTQIGPYASGKFEILIDNK